jgi:hypothetical protein
MTALQTRPALQITAEARAAIADLSLQRPLAILINWPGAVAVTDAETFRPTAEQVVVTHVRGCPIWLDLVQRNASAVRQVTLDTAGSEGHLQLLAVYSAV